jgi:hypothetical protein
MNIGSPHGSPRLAPIVAMNRYVAFPPRAIAGATRSGAATNVKARWPVRVRAVRISTVCALTSRWATCPQWARRSARRAWPAPGPAPPYRRLNLADES